MSVSKLLPVISKFELSANETHFRFEVEGRLLMFIKNNSGPRMLPCFNWEQFTFFIVKFNILFPALQI